MTNLLVKLFVKDNQNIENQNVRTSYGILASIVGVICNVILFAVKISIGIVIDSISVTADAFNNLSDAASAVISFFGVKLANRPADREHPFGHGRYEYIAALAVAFLVLQVGVSCIQSSFEKILHPVGMEFKLVLVVILGISVLVKVWLGIFNRTLGNRISSTVMKATATDAFGDVLITSATIVSIIISEITGLKIDGYMGFAVSVVIMFAGIKIAKETLEPLLGQAVSPEEYEKISKKVESYEGIIGTHDLIVHNYGPTHTMATIHAEVPSDINFEVAHETIDKIEREVCKEMGIFLVIHMDPIEVKNETVQKLKKMVVLVVQELEEKATIHDFRMVNGEKKINLIFDLVVPHSYTEGQEEQLVLEVKEQVSKQDKRCECIITLEHSFVAR